MKHNNIKSFIKELSKKIDSSKSNKKGLLLKNFHPSLIFLMADASKHKYIFYFKDGTLDSFSYIFSNMVDEGKMAVLPFVNNDYIPEGFGPNKTLENFGGFFSSISNFNFRYILSEASVENIEISKQSLENAPLEISAHADMNVAIDWVVRNNYTKTPLVVSEGEYSVRGGILDVFSYGLNRPVRINFLENTPVLSFFDVDTQLSTKNISEYILQSNIAKTEKTPIKNILSKNYISVYIDGNNAFFVNKNYTDEILSPLKYVSFDYFNNHRSGALVSPKPHLNGFSIFLNKEFWVPENFLISHQKENHSLLSIENFNVGDFFVHKTFGVGVFYGLKNSLDGFTEQLVLKYKNSEFVNISVENMGDVSFFAPKYEEGVLVDSISGKGSWGKKINSLKSQLDIVVDSILLSMTKKSKMFRQPYFTNEEDLLSFLKEFPYKDTRDQKKSWISILKDLKSTRPMNRLLCGDVGFGKTEIAMRAAFVVSFSKQVVVLAPTTILSLQIYNSFVSRFKNFPQNICLLNRLIKNKEKLQIYNKISSGSVDIVVGTHAVLSDKILFKNLGLVIIDEEHRFGVKQKEKISSLSYDVDTLLMSATPIPRSLQQSFSGFKNLSLIKSAPRDRKPIKTKVLYSNNAVLNKYILAEHLRGGQTYIVYNNVDNIENYSKKIQNLFPHLVISFIHGQLSSLLIEKTLSAFIEGKINILICSTIIEAGLDVPNTNTILIENSHLLGLAQLYQLRGRVGRSFKQAFAILLVPRSPLSNLSKRRLKTIEKHNALGSGYEVAKKDLSIRGSGSLFGYSQSGSFSYVGKELYSQLLNESIKKNSPKSSINGLLLSDVSVNIYKNLQIEESFISNQYFRFDIYKKIFSAHSLSVLSKIEAEIIDRFGFVSDGLFCLFNTQKIRILCSSLGIKNIVLNSSMILRIVFTDKTKKLDSVFEKSNKYFSSSGLSFKFNNSIENSLILEANFLSNLNIFNFLNSFLNKLL